MPVIRIERFLTECFQVETDRGFNISYGLFVSAPLRNHNTLHSQRVATYLSECFLTITLKCLIVALPYLTIIVPIPVFVNISISSE